MRCSQSVKPATIQNSDLEMFPSGHLECTHNSAHNEPLSAEFQKTLGKLKGNVHQKTRNILNEPSIFPKFSRVLPKVVHCGWNCEYIPNVPLGNISRTPFWSILGFTGWEHHNHTAGETTKKILNEPLRKTAITFLGNILSFLKIFPMGDITVTCPRTLQMY